MKQHFVTFLSPGTFVAEDSTQRIEGWDVEQACEMAHGVRERHSATPYGFYFTTRTREPEDLDSKQTSKSPMYYLGGEIRTLEEVAAANDPSESILLSNMRCNGYDRIITNYNSWQWTQPLKPDDVVLEWAPRQEAPDGA